MYAWDKVTAEIWIDITPEEVRVATQFDEIAFGEDGVSYRSHLPEHRPGPLAEVFEKLHQRFDYLPVTADALTTPAAA